MNPVAGMGGAVGLKGTDGPEILREAHARGAKKVAPARAIAALSEIKKRRIDLEILTVAGEMGGDELEAVGLEYRTAMTPPLHTRSEDTVRAVETFLAEQVELVLFAGGDGTARDILVAADMSVPILGIPAGVKMHSSVFAVAPEKAADAVAAFVQTGKSRDAEVMDVDEESIREGVVKARLFGVARVPDDSSSLQATKDAYHSVDAEAETDELAAYLAEIMDRHAYYILGPGSTTAAVARHLGVEKTILGVDVVRDGELIKKDAAEKDLMRLVERGPAKIVVSPVGAQGFFFGRGNQQISSSVVEAVGIENIIVIATPTKLRDTPVLRVDTGDLQLDAEFGGHVKVVIGYGRKRLVKVA